MTSVVGCGTNNPLPVLVLMCAYEEGLNVL